MDNQETAEGFAPTPLESVFNRREAEPSEAPPAGQQEAPAPEPSVPETGDTPRAETANEPVRQPDGKFAPKPKAEDGPPPSEAQEPAHVPAAAIKAEREKRQAAERRLEELNARLADMERRTAVSQQPPAPPAEQVDPHQAYWQDPVAYTQQVVQPIQQQLMEHRFQTSEMLARTRFADYADAEAAFHQAVQAQAQTLGLRPQDTPLAAALRNSHDPAGTAYSIGKQAMVFGKIGNDPDAYINAEVERRLSERMATQTAPQASPKAPALPANPASLRSTGGPSRAQPTFTGPTPLETVLGQRKRR